MTLTLHFRNYAGSVDAVKSGKALYAGISNYPPEAAVLAYNYLKEKDVPCLLHQGRYNMLNRQAEKMAYWIS